jgi:hypothetical protein
LISKIQRCVCATGAVTDKIIISCWVEILIAHYVLPVIRVVSLELLEVIPERRRFGLSHLDRDRVNL